MILACLSAKNAKKTMGRKWMAKKAILSSFRPDPDFSGLAILRRLSIRETRRLLLWLDQSGLALYFLRKLQTAEATTLLGIELRDELEQRLFRNRQRTNDLLEEFKHLSLSFCAFDVPVAALKGFTLVPDYCPEPHLRHQTDFDFLVEPRYVDAAAIALQTCGYTTEHLTKSGESCFTTPLRHVPSRADDLYAVQRQRQVDLHTSLWEECAWISLEHPSDCMNHRQPRILQDIRFDALSPEDAFIFQVFHSFRHTFRSWIRVSWLLEISRFLLAHQEDENFWARVTARAGRSEGTRRIFAFVLELTSHLFECPVPHPLARWVAGALPDSVHSWFEQFSVRWILSDWPGSLLNIFLATDFIQDHELRTEYWKSRLLPGKAQLTIGKIRSSNRNMQREARNARWQYVAHRSAKHFGNVLSLPLNQIRWILAQRLTRSHSIESQYEITR